MAACLTTPQRYDSQQARTVHPATRWLTPHIRSAALCYELRPQPLCG